MINRALMQRQLRNRGGVMTVKTIRKKYGLGSDFQDFKDKALGKVRDIIPNELADVAVKAAPFVAPFNPLAAAAMRGIGRFDQRGSISDALKQGAGTFAFGYGARKLGGADGIGGFSMDSFSSPLSAERTEAIGNLFKSDPTKAVNKVDEGAITAGVKGEESLGLRGLIKKGIKALPKGVAAQLAAGTITAGASLLASYFQGDFREQEPEETMEDYLAVRKEAVGGQMRTYMDNYFKFDSEYSTMTDAQKDAFVARYNVRDGGRIGFANGGLYDGDFYKEEAFYQPELNRINPNYTMQDYISKGAPLDFLNQYYNQERIRSELDNLESILGGYDFGGSSISEDLVPLKTEARPYNDPRFDFNNLDQYQALIDKYKTIDLSTLPEGTRYGRAGSGYYQSAEEKAKDLENLRKSYLEEGYFNKNLKPDPIALAARNLTPKTATPTTATPTTAAPTTAAPTTAAPTPTGIQTIPGEKKVFNVMMDEKGNVQDDQSLTELFRETGTAPYIGQNNQINSMSDVFRLAGITGEDGISMGTDYGESRTLPSGGIANTLPRGINMRNTLQENLAANEEQRAANQRVLQAARAKLPGAGIMNAPAAIMPPMSSEFRQGPGEFADPNVSAANPGGYASQDEAIADLGLERYNQLYNMGGRVGFANGTEKPRAYEVLIDKEGLDREAEERVKKINELAERISKEKGISFSDALEQAISIITPNTFSNDGKTNMDGSPKINKAKGGLMGIPVRKNSEGTTELDYRKSGGFVPIGVKEKADDVPAMLSKNEFVMTADAVRAAGGGSIEKGAQKMYDTMKKLESRVA